MEGESQQSVSNCSWYFEGYENFANAAEQGISFVGYTGVEGGRLACGTYRADALY